MIRDFQRENPRLLSSSNLLKIRRSVSYMTFILKEIVEFICETTDDGKNLYVLRQYRKEYDRLNDIFQSIVNNN